MKSTLQEAREALSWLESEAHSLGMPVDRRHELAEKIRAGLNAGTENDFGTRDKLIQVSGFGVENTVITQCSYMLVGLTESGCVLMSTGDGQWINVTGD